MLMSDYTDDAISDSSRVAITGMLVWLISHQSTVLLSKKKPTTNNQPTLLLSKKKPATNNQQQYISLGVNQHPATNR
jgi:hypothetical protein